MTHISKLRAIFATLSNKYNLLVFISWFIVLASTTSVLIDQPFAGFTTKLANGLVFVDHVYDKTIDLSENTQVKAVTADGFSPIKLNTSNTPFDPNAIANTYAKFNRFLDHNKKMAEIFSSRSVTIITPDKAVTIQPKSRPLHSLPLAYWATALAVLISSLIAVGILSVRRGDLSARLLVAAALLFMFLSMFTSAFTYRILFIDPSIFTFYLNIQHLFGNFFPFAMLSLIAVYPQRLIGGKLLFFLLTVEPLVFWLNDHFQWIELPIHTFFFNSLFAACLFIIFAIIQVYSARKDPLQTAQVRWLLMSIFIMPILDIFLYLLPLAAGMRPLIPLWMVQISIVVGFIGLGLGIARYRLFDIERWWFKTWIWVIAGVLLVIVDIILLAMLNITSTEAIALSIMIIAWVYFPARQWLWEKIAKSPDTKLEDYLPILAESVFKSDTSGQSIECWKHCLQEIFQAISTEIYPHKIDKASIENSGLSLLIPSISVEHGGIKLSGRNKGTRLFHKDDPILATSINKIITQMVDVKIATLQAANQERSRIMRDLHDDVGANILSMIYRAKDEEQAQYARDTLKLLRESIYTLDDSVHSSLHAAIFEWQQEAQQRIQDANIKLSWEDHRDQNAILLTARQKINIGRILREAISNIIKHSRADWVKIVLKVSQNKLIVCVTNNGSIAPKDSWVEGKGINNIRIRTQELGGTVKWKVKDSKQLSLTVTLPINTKL